MKKHEFEGTQGVWNHKKGKRSKFEYDNTITDEKGNHILKWSNTGTYCHKLTIKESQANGKLISKAPEMLEMLIKVLEIHNENYGNTSSTYQELETEAPLIESLIKSVTKIN